MYRIFCSLNLKPLYYDLVFRIYQHHPFLVRFGAHPTEPDEYTGSYTPIEHYQIQNRRGINGETR
jgi:hypothetical protein